MGARSAILVWTGALAACAFDSSGVASAGASGVQEGGESTTSIASADDTASTTSNGSMSATGGATTMPGTTIDPTTTTAVDTGETSSGATIDPSQGTSTGGADTAHLQHGTHATCNEPMWCNYGSLYDPAGGPHAGQECFVSPFATSQITAIDYNVAAVATELAYWSLEVYTPSAGMPGQLIQAIPMTAPDATVGAHHIVVEPPIALTDTPFCVGFRTTGPGLQGALGFASSEESQVVGESWFISDDCSVYYWSDVITTVGQPRGNWCISVDLESG